MFSQSVERRVEWPTTTTVRTDLPNLSGLITNPFIHSDAIVQLNNCTLARSVHCVPGTHRMLADLQRKDQADLLSWEDEKKGPPHAPQWTSWCKSM